MGTTQLIGYHRDQINLSNTFKALGHPARIEIINLLLEEKLTVNEIADRLPIARPTVMRHLRILFNTNLIGYQSFFNCTYYAVNPNTLEDVVEFISYANKHNGKHVPLHKVYFNKLENEL